MTENAADDAENQQAVAQFQKHGDELAAEAERRGEALVTIGERRTVSCGASGAEAASAPAQFVTIPKDAKQFFDNFQVVAARIGDDIDDIDVLDETLDALDHGEPVPAGPGERVTNTCHSSIYLSMWTWALEQAQAALASKDWPDAYKRLAALQSALCRYDSWLKDTDDPEGAQEFCTALATAWDKMFTVDSNKWTARQENVDAVKAAIRDYAAGLRAYEREDSPPGTGYDLTISGVTS